MALKNGLYEISYSGSSGVGAGTICIGDGRFAGFDVGGGNYVGEMEQGGAAGDFKGTVSFPQGGKLVTGQTAPPGISLPISGRFPPTGGPAEEFDVTVAGHMVKARIVRMT